MVYCYKADIENPLLVHLKRCEGGKFCHGKLNRCKDDPYNNFENKLPGSICEFDFECISNKCSKGICLGSLTKENC